MDSSGAVDRFYTRWAVLYDHVARHTPGIMRLRGEMIDRMELSPGNVVLDMGCGPGPNFRPIRRDVGSSGQVLGVDMARGALGRARTHVRRSGWTNVHVVRADATAPPLTDADALTAAFVVGMFEEPVRVVDEWCDLLGSGGRIGLLHFARSDRSYAAIPNLGLRAIVLVSTPGENRVRTDATDLLDRRVRAAHDQLADRCRTFERTSHWGGLIHLITGTID